MKGNLENTSRITHKMLIIKKIALSMVVFLGLGLSVPLAFAQNIGDLWIYVQNNRADQVDQLLKRGLDPNTTTDRGNPIIMQAVRDGSWAVFDVLMKHPNTNIKIMNGYQETPLMYVSLMGDLPRAQALVNRGAEVNHLGWTPLHYAASKAQLDVVKYLLSQGAMPNAPAPNGTSPIMMAATIGEVEVVQALLDAGADPSAVNLSGENAAAVARKAKHNRLADSLEQIIRKRQNP